MNIRRIDVRAGARPHSQLYIHGSLMQNDAATERLSLASAGGGDDGGAVHTTAFGSSLAVGTGTSRRTKPTSGSAHAPRVLHAIAPSRLAGAETFLLRLLRRSPPDEFVARCVTSHNRANDELLAANLPFDRLRINGKANLLAIPRIRAAARRFQADVIHTHLSTASWWAGWLEQLGGPPSVGHVHGFTSAAWHRFQRHLIAGSQAVKQDLIAKGIAAEKISVLHYPLDGYDVRPTRSRSDIRQELGAERNTRVVGTFAHLSVKKGYRELVEAAALVLATIPTAQFWCFGEGPLRVELEQSASRLGIASRFKLFGFRRDVADLMPAIDVMCLPSHREPFGLVYLEAALAKKPVIACDAGGVPEIVSHNETGLLVPPPNAATNGCAKLKAAGVAGASVDNVSALASVLFTLLDNPSMATEMGQRAYDAALDRFRWSDYLARLADIYQLVRGQSL